MKRIFLTITLAVLAASPAFAYDAVETHQRMTIVATQKSVLYTDGAIMYALGLLPASRQQFTYYGRQGDVRSGLSLFSTAVFVAQGAIDEDDGTAPKNHFYDPVKDRPLTQFLIPLGEKSPDWMTEPSPLEGQSFSLHDARAYLLRALTYHDGTALQAETERQVAVSSVLLALGHAMHHMQDMAQPQHVRNDQHYDGSGAWYLAPFYNPSRYEYYTKRRPDSVSAAANAASPNFPGGTEFKTARDFWVNSAHTGIAERVNNDFVSQGTNFTLSLFGNVNTGTYANPQPGSSADYPVGSLYAASGLTVPSEIQTLCGNAAIDCTMTMYSTPVQQKASTLSIFDQDLRAKGVEVVYVHEAGTQYITHRLFDLNRFNFDDAHPILINRAVSYSAGIVNHFFRGKLDVLPPINGPYAVADHANGDGFHTVKTTVVNITPSEALGGGTIRAIAKFYRNGCYQPDLSGEFQLNSLGQLVTPCPSYRSYVPEVRVSAEQQVSFAIDEDKELTFTFDQPIPFDATDLMLQVYYNGQVGTETDSHALGAVDVSEPTFIALWNATDVFELSGAFYYWQDIVANIGTAPYSAIDNDDNGIYNVPPDVRVDGSAADYEVYIDGAKVANAAGVPEGRFTRLAAIVDPTQPLLVTWIARGTYFAINREHLLQPKLFQYNYSTNQWRITPVARFRNVLQNDSIAMYGYAPSPVASLDSMPESRATDAGVPVPSQIATQSRNVSVLWNDSLQQQPTSSQALAPQPAMSFDAPVRDGKPVEALEPPMK